MRAANVPHRSNRAVITPTGLDIHRYICNVMVRRLPERFFVLEEEKILRSRYSGSGL